MEYWDSVHPGFLDVHPTWQISAAELRRLGLEPPLLPAWLCLGVSPILEFYDEQIEVEQVQPK